MNTIQNTALTNTQCFIQLANIAIYLFLIFVCSLLIIRPTDKKKTHKTSYVEETLHSRRVTWCIVRRRCTPALPPRSSATGWSCSSGSLRTKARFFWRRTGEKNKQNIKMDSGRTTERKAVIPRDVSGLLTNGIVGCDPKAL